MRKRSKSILVRFTDEEYDRLNALIELSQLTQQEYGRRCLMDKRITVIEGFKDYTDELKRVGNNLNQLTRSIHQNELQHLYEDFDNLNRELRQTWQSLSEFLEKVQQRKS